MQNGNKCRCFCHCPQTVGFLVFLFGLVFLLGTFDVLSPRVVSIAWPILIMIAGLKKFASGMCKCCEKACKE